jgi:Tfp pilus assembly protein PilV
VRSRTNTTKRGAANCRGFTLLETTVAMLVLMVVSMGVVGALLYAMNSNLGAGNRSHANAVAQRQIEYLQNVPFVNLEAAVTAAGGAAKVVQVEGHSFNVATAFQYAPSAAAPTLKTVVVTVTPQGVDPNSWAQSPVQARLQRTTQVVGPYSK